ncbi:hypothetical protein RND81_09G029900 [Saponaria officinalis]|uniref:UspA domain-containing protein n=1 Tax=Saponaria officinalis TaxID=3572 RepID=A0AAW1II35_SAPOF
MNNHEELQSQGLHIPPIKTKPPTTTNTTTITSSPRVTVSTPTATATGAFSVDTPTAGAARKIAIAVDLSDESAFAVKWAVDHYIRPGDAVVLLHVRPTSVLYGADWGCVDVSGVAVVDNDDLECNQKLEDDFDAFTTSKASDLAQPLIDAQVPYKIHIVKDHDMKERLCLEVERLGFHAVIMGSRGFGASKRASNGRLGSVSDYCVRHCVCPVVVVRCPDEKDGNVDDAMVAVAEAEVEGVAEEDEEYHDAFDERKATA